MRIDRMSPIQALRCIRELCDPMDARFDAIKDICDSVLNHFGGGRMSAWMDDGKDVTRGKSE